ncbi:MAG: Uma2 family endonuclease [Candidatus Binatia bacterium]
MSQPRRKATEDDRLGVAPRARWVGDPERALRPLQSAGLGCHAGGMAGFCMSPSCGLATMSSFPTRGLAPSAHADVPDIAAFSVAPDWVCEVRSASTTRVDRGPRMTIDARGRIGHLWFVDPPARGIEVSRWKAQSFARIARQTGSGEITAQPFATTPLALARCWGEA